MKKGIIYKIVNPMNEVYIGSTTRAMSARMAEHKYRAKNGSKSLLYDSIRQYGIEAHKVEIVCYVNENILDLEHFIIEEFKPSLNLVSKYNATANNKVWVNDGTKEFQIYEEDFHKHKNIKLGRFNYVRNKHKLKT